MRGVAPGVVPSLDPSPLTANALLRYQVEGHTADDLIAAATAYGDNAPVWPEWLEAVQDVGKNKLGQLDSHTLGRWLARNRDRMIEARKLVRTGTPTRPRWKVEIHTSREPA